MINLTKSSKNIGVLHWIRFAGGMLIYNFNQSGFRTENVSAFLVMVEKSLLKVELSPEITTRFWWVPKTELTQNCVFDDVRLPSAIDPHSFYLVSINLLFCFAAIWRNFLISREVFIHCYASFRTVIHLLYDGQNYEINAPALIKTKTTTTILKH